jgi:alkylation response protein AidB-like acyl-CoA dehydrogenase
LYAVHVPTEFGGDGADALAAVLIIEEVARVWFIITDSRS